MLKRLPRVVIRLLATRFLLSSSYTAVSFEGMQYYKIHNYTLQPNERKNVKFLSEIGKVYSTFRFSLFMSSFIAMQRNSFKTLRKTLLDSVVTDDINTGSRDDSESKTKHQMLSPVWLNPGYIVSEHRQTVASKMECGHADNSDDEQSSGRHLRRLKVTNQATTSIRLRAMKLVMQAPNKGQTILLF